MHAISDRVSCRKHSYIIHDVQGTNGGVTWTGLAASLAGGLLMGLVFWSMGAISPRLYTVPFQQEPAIGQWSLVVLGAAHVPLLQFCSILQCFCISPALQYSFIHFSACKHVGPKVADNMQWHSLIIIHTQPAACELLDERLLWHC